MLRGIEVAGQVLAAVVTVLPALPQVGVSAGFEGLGV